MRLSHVALPLARLGVLLALAFAFLLGSYVRAVQSWPALSVTLYAARLGSVWAIAVFGAWSVLERIEARPAWGRRLSTGLLLLVSSPAIYYVSAHVAAGDGLRARGVPVALSLSVAGLSLLLLEAVVWSYRYWARRRVSDVALALLALLVILASAAFLQRAQTELASSLQLIALVLACQLTLLCLGSDAQLLLRTGGACAASVLMLALGALCLPTLCAEGRRRALVAEGPVAHVAGRIARALRVSHVSHPPLVDRAQCAALRAPTAFPPLALAPEQRRNVILISIDTLRADHVSAREGDAPLMPGLTSFCAEARYAPAAQTGFPATALAMSSAFSGYWPSDLLLAPKPLPNIFLLAREQLEVVEAVLPRSRYFTRPEVESYLLRGAKIVAAGSARQETHYALRRLRELREQGKRHLMWLHYFEPHEPYDKQPPFDFGDSDNARYRSELAFVDQQLSQLLAFLREGGWYEDSLIVIFADHGESFGEHGHENHHYLLYPWLATVPLVWRTPDSRPGRIEAPLHLMDVTPTVLHFLGISAPSALRGRSLLAPLPPDSRALFSEEISVTGRQMLQYQNEPVRDERELLARFMRLADGPGYPSKLAVRRGDAYLIEQRASRAHELYAWREDPSAARDLTQEEPSIVTALRAEAERFASSVYARALCELPAQ